MATDNGSPFISNATNASGAYLLENLRTSRSYVVTPSYSGNVNGITSFDATLVLRHVAAGGAGANALSADQQLAADGDGSGDVSSFDATLILRYVAASGANAGTQQIGNWKFFLPSRNYAQVYESLSEQNYKAILIGEVDGDWLP